MTYLDTYAWVLFRKKEYTLARQYIDAVLRIMRIDPERPEEAPEPAPEGDGEAAAPDREPSAEVLDHAGDIYFMTGDRKQAIAFWRAAHALEPDNELIGRKVAQKTIFFE